MALLFVVVLGPLVKVQLQSFFDTEWRRMISSWPYSLGQGKQLPVAIGQVVWVPRADLNVEKMYIAPGIEP